jgi:hypothetical protein
MIRLTATGTKTITSIDVHTEREPGRILLGAHLLVHEGSPAPMTVTIPPYGGVPATGTLAVAGDVAANAAATTRLPGLAGTTPARPASTFPSGRDHAVRRRQGRHHRLDQAGRHPGFAQRTCAPSPRCNCAATATDQRHLEEHYGEDLSR